MISKNTSWGGVAGWYDDMLEAGDQTYQKTVIMPNLLRIVDPHAGMTMADVACGQGYFSRAFADNGTDVIGCDVSKELIEIAKKNSHRRELTSASSPNPGKPKPGKLEFHVTPADSLSPIQEKTVDVATIVLALQNIDNFSGTLKECSRILKPGGRLILVLNHPAFRIPGRSSWQKDEKVGAQYRRIDGYMSEQTSKIDMTPGEKEPSKKNFTISFHRPLQSYFKSLNKSGLAVKRLEEWISDRKSQPGPHSVEEDRIRKEIPLFLCIEAEVVQRA